MNSLNHKKSNLAHIFLSYNTLHIPIYGNEAFLYQNSANKNPLKKTNIRNK